MAKLALYVGLLAVAFAYAPEFRRLFDETLESSLFAKQAHQNLTQVWTGHISPVVASMERTTGVNLHQALPWVALAIGLALWLAPSAYSFFFARAKIVRRMDEVEREADGEKFPSFGRPRRQRGLHLPPPYPNTWYKVSNSEDVPKGEARDFEILGTFLVVFRGMDGKVRILDGYCPHMGAHLGITGRVVGNDIVCPFHGWQFDGDGQCTRIPYAEKVPEFIKTKSWHCVETNGMIAIWHDAEGRPPQWMIPDIKEINTGRYTYHGSTLHQVRSHIQDIPENGADTAHLNWLHLPITIRFLSNLGFHHAWEATWEAGQGVDEHLALMAVTESIQFHGWHVPGSCVDVNIVQVGPGIVHMQFATPLGKVILIQTVTPVQPLLQRVGHQVFADWTVPRFFAKIIMRSSVSQFERDVPLWNNKIYLDHPNIVKEDGPISKYRRWAKLFYSENSEKVAQERAATVNPMEW